jgi:thiol:disulfide interchange protein/DsbC/DsbD-like thiol-disulfide interchange protein
MLFRRSIAALLVAVCALPAAMAQTSSGYNALADLGLGASRTALVASGSETSTAVTSDQTEVQLLTYAPQGVAPGRTMWLGLRITHAPNWHTYWKNSGDSGLPTTLDWQLPAGWQAGELAWPTPKKFVLGPLANYGFDGSVLLATPVVLPAQLSATNAVALEANWLACKTECIPEDAQLSVALSPDQPLLTHAALFEDALARAPQDRETTASLTPSADGTTWRVAGLPSPWVGQDLELFPETTGLIAPGAPWTQTWERTDGRDVWVAQVPQHAFRAGSPQQVPTVLALAQHIKGQPADAGVRVQVLLDGAWPEVSASSAVSPALQQALDAAAANAGNTNAGTTNTSSASGATLLLTLAAAMLGGLLLNLMPCVFPVLALKVLAFAQPGTSARSHRQAGLAYTAGVVLSFVALGGLLLALRSAGEALGWGFQLQNPVVVASLALLFTLIALNLFGVFEFGNMLPQSVLNARAKHPSVDAFVSGVLATAVASPCTAPFMGASLGLAIVWPTAQALAVFAALGLGMAAPYLLASWLPGVAQRLPKPGAWMARFKTVMAFPMLATVVWLVWVVGQQTSMNGAGALLLLLLSLAFAVWCWQQGDTRLARRVWRGVGALTLAVAVWALWQPATQTTPAQMAGSASAGAATTTSANNGNNGNTLWQAWTPGAVEAHVAQGRTVFVDFSAAWCVTCQVNELTTLASTDVLQAFAQHDVVLLKADWTRRDSAITQALNALGRSGVPTYALYRPNAAPQVLPEVLSNAMVINAVTQR